MLGEKEDYKFLGILETDTIKLVWMKEEIRVPQMNKQTSRNQAQQ